MSDNSKSVDLRIVEQRGDETSILLQAGGWDRWVDGCVKSMKLFGWTFGEGFLASQLLAAIGWKVPAPFGELIDAPPPPWAALFILLFAVGWTVVGVSMISSLLRLLFGSDRIVLTTSEIRVRRRVGPFGRERVFTPGRIDWVAIKGATRVLIISVASKEVVIASLGTWPDRRFVAETLEERYGLKTPSELAHGAAPAGWVSERSVDGFVSFRKAGDVRALIGCTGAISAVCWLIAGAGIFIRLIDETQALKLTFGDGLKFAVAVTSTILVYWTARRSETIRARRNELVIESKFGPWKHHRRVSDASLQVSFRTTTRSLDDVFTLEAVNQDKLTTLCVRLNDATEVVALARALALPTGWNLEIAPQALQA
ncbi:MAG TPA: hypothetical protein VHL58_16420 [Thermoanaerobaculia bacterium]|nr:hypothetical protein [Thermoanaerobaculia bacterium]